MIEKAFGNSVRGKMHKKSHLPNQDSYLVKNNKDFTVAVVCDGLGSKKYSHHASKRLCLIAYKTINKNRSKKDVGFYHLISQIQHKYIKELWPFHLQNADTTFILAYLTNKSIVLCQVGDGLAEVTANGEIIRQEQQVKDFTNETISFGRSNKSNWKVRVIKKVPNTEYKVLLCTDGISEDILEETKEQFVELMANSINGKYKKNKYIKKILNEWPNKYSSDDKTLVVIK